MYKDLKQDWALHILGSSKASTAGAERRGSGRDRARIYRTRSPEKQFGFHTKYNGKSMESFQWKRNMTYFVFLKSLLCGEWAKRLWKQRLQIQR